MTQNAASDVLRTSPTATTPPIVYVVDDDALARKSVLVLVQSMGMPVEGFASAEEFLDCYDGHRPACLVTDVRMLGMSGLELQERLEFLGISMAVVVLTAHASTPTTVRAMKNGALTLLEKPCLDDELWEAIRLALLADKRNWQSESSREALLDRLARLTPKEHVVLEHIVAGLANKQIARKLDVSVRTVENHRQKIFHKMQADSVAELVKMALAIGISDDFEI